MDFQTKRGKDGTELWINRRYHGTFRYVEDMMRYVWELSTGQHDVEPDPQQRLEWD